jgi:hypothetical protein
MNRFVRDGGAKLWSRYYKINVLEMPSSDTKPRIFSNFIFCDQEVT